LLVEQTAHSSSVQYSNFIATNHMHCFISRLQTKWSSVYTFVDALKINREVKHSKCL